MTLDQEIKQKMTQQAERRREATNNVFGRVISGLLDLGFSLDYTSRGLEFGSQYYRHSSGLVVRVSDHRVPKTAERQCVSSWATHGLQFVIEEFNRHPKVEDADRFLNQVREELA